MSQMIMLSLPRSYLQCFIVALVTLSSFSFATTIEVLQPIRWSGDEVSLIFIPGAMIKGEAYKETAVAVQKASQLRLWVALTGNYTLQTPNPLQLPRAIDKAISALRDAGMKGDNHVGIAHSLGGVFLGSYAKRSPLMAIVLLGSYLNRRVKLQEYPLPVLTLSGELDGQTRITRVALAYEQLESDFKESSCAIYRTPVINIKGSNHAQFASGPMPQAVQTYDIKPDITNEEAHAEIGTQVNNFLVATFSSSFIDRAKAHINLTKAFIDSGRRFQPLLDVKALDVNGSSSPWAITAQSILAGELVNKTKITNSVEKALTFAVSTPKLKSESDGVSIKTSCLVDYPRNIADISTIKESPVEIDLKMISREAIVRELKSGNPDGPSPTCKFLNEKAFEVAMNTSTSEARQRYLSRGRPLTLKDDASYTNELRWRSKDLQTSEDDAGLHVQSVAFTSDVKDFINPGRHYCKVLSPYRAMEWINVDSLREHKPRG